MTAPQTPRDESVLEMVCGILSLLWWTLILVGGLGVTLIVGLTAVEPRPAALFMLPAVVIVWVSLSTREAIRRAALFGWA